MSALTSVEGPFDGYDKTGMLEYAGEGGSGYFIGNGLILTAGHVEFEYNRASDGNPANITTANIVTSNPVVSAPAVVADYRGYQALYAAQASATLSADLKNGIDLTAPIASNATAIENQPSLVANDSVVVAGSGTVGKNSAGLVYFMDPSDLTSANLNAILGSATLGESASVSRRGEASGSVTGNILTASGGALTFDHTAQQGDSGGAYLLNYNLLKPGSTATTTKTFVIGTQSANNVTTSQALGTYFTQSDFSTLSTLVTQGLTGDLAKTQPTNLIVGTSGDDTIMGTARADILLGEAGNDTLIGSNGDTLDGGAGNDVEKLMPNATFKDPITVDFSQGGGSDVAETVGRSEPNGQNGDYVLNLQGLKPSDISVIAGGENIYGTSSDPNQMNAVVWEFITFKINATGEEITFVDDNKQVGPDGDPTMAQAGTTYAASHSPVSTVEFGDGTKWTAATLWKMVANISSTPSVSEQIYSPLNAPGFQETLGSQFSFYGSAAFISQLNSTSFQADPLAAGPSSPQAAAAPSAVHMAAAMAAFTGPSSAGAPSAQLGDGVSSNMMQLLAPRVTRAA